MTTQLIRPAPGQGVGGRGPRAEGGRQARAKLAWLPHGHLLGPRTARHTAGRRLGPTRPSRGPAQGTPQGRPWEPRSRGDGRDLPAHSRVETRLTPHAACTASAPAFPSPTPRPLLRPEPPAPGGRTPQCPGRGPASGFARGAARTGPRSPVAGPRATAAAPLPLRALAPGRSHAWHTPRTEPLGRGFTSGDPSGRPQWGRRPRPGRAPGVVLVCPRQRPATLAGVPSGDRALQGCRGRGAARHLRPEPGHTAGHTGHVPAAGATGGSRFWLPLRGLGSAVTSSFVCDTGPSQAQRPCACSGRRLPRGPGVTRLPLSPGWGLKQGGPGGAGEPEATPHVQSSNSRNVGETRTPPGRPGQPTSLGSRGWGRTVPVHAALTPRGMLGPQGLLPLPVPLLGDLWGRER